jgi:hypothetical protein
MECTLIENFDSPTWGIVAHCEYLKKGMVIFVGIVDGRGSARDMKIQEIGRLLVASYNIVLTGNPRFTKHINLF